MELRTSPKNLLQQKSYCAPMNVPKTRVYNYVIIRVKVDIPTIFWFRDPVIQEIISVNVLHYLYRRARQVISWYHLANHSQSRS